MVSHITYLHYSIDRLWGYLIVHPNQKHPSSKKVAANQKHPSCKKGCSQDLKGYDEKDEISKGGGQGLCKNAVDHIKNFNNDDLQVPQYFVAWVIIFNVINCIPAQPSFDFTSFSSYPFSGLGHNFFTAGCFWLGFHFF